MKAVRKIPTRAQQKGEKAGEWASLWFVGIITFLWGMCTGSYKAVKDNIAMPDWLGDDEDDDDAKTTPPSVNPAYIPPARKTK